MRYETWRRAWAPIEPAFHIYYPGRRQMPPGLRELIDTLRLKAEKSASKRLRRYYDPEAPCPQPSGFESRYTRNLFLPYRLPVYRAFFTGFFLGGL